MLRRSSLAGSHTGPRAGTVHCFSAGKYDGFFRGRMLRSGSGSGAAAMSRQMQFIAVSYTLSLNSLKSWCKGGGDLQSIELWF